MSSHVPADERYCALTDKSVDEKSFTGEFYMSEYLGEALRVLLDEIQGEVIHATPETYLFTVTPGINLDYLSERAYARGFEIPNIAGDSAEATSVPSDIRYVITFVILGRFSRNNFNIYVTDISPAE